VTPRSPAAAGGRDRIGALADGADARRAASALRALQLLLEWT